MLAADRDARDVAIVLGSEIARCTAYTATHVEDSTAFFQMGTLEQELDEVDLSDFFGVGWGEEVAVVDVLAPCGRRVGLIMAVIWKRAYQRE